MTASQDAQPSSAVLGTNEIPRVGTLSTLSRMLRPGADRRDMRGLLKAQYEAHGNVVMQKVFTFRMVNLFGPDANRLVLLDREGIFSARKPWMAIMGKIFPDGLLLMDGEEHKNHRRMMFPAFKRPVMRQYAEQMTPIIVAALADWHQRDDLLAFYAFKELTLDMAAVLFLGEPLGSETREMKGAFEAMVAASMSRVRLPIPGLEFHGGLKGREFMGNFLRQRIPARRESGGQDVFSQLCRAAPGGGERLGDQQIIDHIVFLMMAAHDTATSTLTSLTYELARSPEWQERIREESLSVDSQLDFDGLEKLESLAFAMNETLRLYPPLPVIPRTAERAFEFDGYQIPEGSMVVISPIVTHRMEQWWDDPDRFDPERFSPARAEHVRHTHSWIPFGGGPHMCIGHRFARLQVKAIMHHLIRRYRFSVPDGYEMPVQQAPISKPLDGLPLQAELLD